VAAAAVVVAAAVAAAAADADLLDKRTLKAAAHKHICCMNWV